MFKLVRIACCLITFVSFVGCVGVRGEVGGVRFEVDPGGSRQVEVEVQGGQLFIDGSAYASVEQGDFVRVSRDGVVYVNGISVARIEGF